MPGHLFVVQGDLTRIACDAWLLPTSRTLWIEDHWIRASLDQVPGGAIVRGPDDPDLQPGRIVHIFRDVVATPSGWDTGAIRTFEWKDWKTEANRHRPWLTRIAFDHDAPAPDRARWYAEGARQFVESAAISLSGKGAAYKRDRPLLALPVVGAGEGGGWPVVGTILRELLHSLTEALQHIEADVVLVAHEPHQFAAAQHVRRQLWNEAPASDPRRHLPERLRQTADSLAERCADGTIVLFLGAGVSISAGLPSWQSLLDSLADDAGLDVTAKQALSGLPVLDQARFLRDQYEKPTSGTAPRSFSESVRAQVSGTHYSLTHALLASLDVRESVTTNYDTLFEEASRGAKRETAVLPYDSTEGADRWLLKMHGCVTKPNDIVLTREDFLRYADRRSALAGIVQAMLITRHMLFVGFSLADENFLRIADEVKRAIRAPSVSGTVLPTSSFGTALLLDPSPLLAHLWSGDIDCVSIADSAPDAGPLTRDQQQARLAAASRQQEILLDCVLHEVSQQASHILDQRYDGLLSETEKQLRKHLNDLREQASDEVKRLPAWRTVESMLTTLGADETLEA